MAHRRQRNQPINNEKTCGYWMWYIAGVAKKCFCKLVDGLNYISPLLTAVATALLAYITYWIWTSDRPWMGLPKISVASSLTSVEGNAKFTISVSFQNVGKSPAFSVFPIIQSVPRGENWVDFQKRVCASEKISKQPDQFAVPPSDIFRAGPIPIEIKLSELGGMSQFAGCLVYRIEQNGTPHQTGFTFSLAKTGDKEIAVGDLPIDVKELEIVQTFIGGRVD